MGVGWRVEFVGMHILSGELKCPRVYNEAIVNPRNPSNIKSPPFQRRALSQRRPERPLPLPCPLPCLTKSHNQIIGARLLTRGLIERKTSGFALTARGRIALAKLG